MTSDHSASSALMAGLPAHEAGEIARAALAFADSAERGARSVGVSLTQLRVLIVIALGRSSPSQVAEALSLTLPSVARIVDRLVAMGAVERTADVADRRRVNQSLTERGRALLAEAEAAVSTAVRNLLGPLSEEDTTLVEDGLRRVIRAGAVHWKSMPDD